MALLLSGRFCLRGKHTRRKSPPADPPESRRSIEDLNLVGAAVSMPAISDSILGTDSGFRRSLFSQGILFRVNVVPRHSLNVLDGPVPADQQVYIGQRPTWITGVNPILTADLRQLHLHNAQLNVGLAWRWTNWNRAGPKRVALSTLYFYKMWGDDRVEMKVGYITNDSTGPPAASTEP